METLLKWLSEINAEVIIISDSNSCFINSSLKKNELLPYVSKVYTNPATFNANGVLEIEYYHVQDWCDLSTENLCKGYILDEHIKKRKAEGVEFDAVAMTGDGGNDYCPSLRINKDGFVFPRIGFTLPKKISEDPSKIKATVCPWNSGEYIKLKLQELLLGRLPSS